MVSANIVGVISILFGLAIVIVPKFLRILVGGYLILIGLAYLLL